MSTVKSVFVGKVAPQPPADGADNGLVRRLKISPRAVFAVLVLQLRARKW